jgi:hypothetical protein
VVSGLGDGIEEEKPDVPNRILFRSPTASRDGHQMMV